MMAAFKGARLVLMLERCPCPTPATPLPSLFQHISACFGSAYSSPVPWLHEIPAGRAPNTAWVTLYSTGWTSRAPVKLAYLKDTWRSGLDTSTHKAVNIMLAPSWSDARFGSEPGAASGWCASERVWACDGKPSLAGVDTTIRSMAEPPADQKCGVQALGCVASAAPR
jgi:hypothetical protein